MKKVKAFSLVEVLIVIAIMGVVAAILIPTFFKGINESSWNTTSNTFVKDFAEALRIMNQDEILAGHATTMDFVKELSKHLNIAKVCESDKLYQCFSKEFTLGENLVNVNELVAASSLNKNVDYDTEVVGIQLASGIVALVAYNKAAEQEPFNNDLIEVVPYDQGGEILTISTDAVSLLFDVNAYTEPNTYGLEDIRGVNIAFSDILYNRYPGVEFGESVSCGQMSLLYFGCLKRRIQAEATDAIVTDFEGVDPSMVSPDGTRMNFEMAVKVCKDKGLRLPSTSEANSLYKSGKYSFNPHDYWVTTEPGKNTCGKEDGIYTGSCENCSMSSGGCGRKESSALNYVRCVK